MQNTIVRGGENGRWEKKIKKLRVRWKKLKRGKKKGGKLHKKRRKGLKNASFWVINLKMFAPPAEKLIRRGKN